MNDIKVCDNCVNLTDDFNNEVDNGCYMCCKGLENNFEPKDVKKMVENKSIKEIEMEYDISKSKAISYAR